MRMVAARFERQGVAFYRLCVSAERTLLLVYQPSLLGRHLRRQANRQLLERYGYRRKMETGEMLALLAERIAAKQGYPHEIGIFLGYPPEDVESFIAQGGKNYALCGYWKVYHNPHAAKQIFSAYDRTREFFCARVLGGERIDAITYGGIVS